MSYVPGPGQDLAIQIADLVSAIYGRGGSVVVKYVHGHERAAGNEMAELYA